MNSIEDRFNHELKEASKYFNENVLKMEEIEKAAEEFHERLWKVRMAFSRAGNANSNDIVGDRLAECDQEISIITTQMVDFGNLLHYLRWRFDASHSHLVNVKLALNQWWQNIKIFGK